ncbi:MAG: M1 family aminopeptidase [Syntrophomonadaceae bacterium]
MKKLLLLPLLIFIISGCRSLESPGKTDYNFNVQITPSEEKITSELRLSYMSPLEKADSITFLLHKNLVVESLTGENLRAFRFDTASAPPLPFTPEAGRLVIKLNSPLAKGEKTDFKLKYSGKIGIVSQWKINRIKEDWVELGLYSPWFPFDPSLKEFSYNMSLGLPEGYKLSVNGHPEYKGGIYYVSNPHADNDIVITASKNMRQWRFSDDSISISLNSASDISDSTAEGILQLGKKILGNYIAWFGSKEGLETSIVISPRQTGGGYARKGFIVLSKISDKDFSTSKTDFVRYFSHEFAHLWFSSAPSDSWEDWLNESFSEFASLMMVRSLAGEKAFMERINKKKEKIDLLPKIRGLNRNSEEAYPVLYNKGCCCLYELEQELGKEEFLKLMKWVYSNRVTSTGMFLLELENKYGKTLATNFSQKLDK